MYVCEDDLDVSSGKYLIYNKLSPIILYKVFEFLRHLRKKPTSEGSKFDKALSFKFTNWGKNKRGDLNVPNNTLTQKSCLLIKKNRRNQIYLLLIIIFS